MEGAHGCAGLVLAAGFSRRMGKENKLLATVEGVPMVRRVAVTAIEAGLHPVAVVTGHDAPSVGAALAGLEVSLCHNEHSEAGLASSLATGLASLPPAGVSGAVVLLGDMPWVTPGHVEALLQAFAPDEGRSICVPTHQRRRGNPVLWAARYFAEMAALRGDEGARRLFAAHPEEIWDVPVEDPGVLRDVDTEDELSRWAGLPEPVRGTGG